MIFRSWKIWYISICYTLIVFCISTIVYFTPLIVDALFSGSRSWSSPENLAPVSERDKVQREVRVALISGILWVPVAVVMLLVGFSAKHFKERNLHSCIPTAVSGLAFM